MVRVLLTFVTLWVSAETLAQVPSVVNKSGSDNLLDVTSVLTGSTDLYKMLSTKIGAIQNELETKQKEDAELVTKQKTEYERQLGTQRSQITTAEALNNHTKKEIEKLKKINAGLRKKASMLTIASREVRMTIDQMSSNLTMAQEFVAKAKDTAHTLLNASELEVVKELDAQDMVLQQRLVHDRRVRSFGLLQVESQKKLSPSNLELELRASFDVLNEQTEASLASLKTVFERRFQAGSEQLHELRDEDVQLKLAKDAEIKLQGRLIIAVEHMKSTYEQLVKRKRALRMFLRETVNESAIEPVN